ncbi:hypothetical protein BD626DRAFT_437887 [Schizophyllum amplum]|uniref:Extracellular membrane protein CFEM domain-containing protein n=1 Tax=Schizophyllum amplum TaxID=97359 RepID=A0A550C1Z4_9AGAR|nr:hypothetical protein BD626DRAFT_437887 [Auriculariopsis ampla]
MSWLPMLSRCGFILVLGLALIPFVRVPFAARATDICADPPRDNCSFYSQCLEARFHCGPDGYPLGYGLKYCTKFGDEREKLSEKGQTWMLDTMYCLQHKLVPEAVGASNVTCDQLEDKAFETHSDCYVQSGLCTLSAVDWLAIVDIVQLPTLFQSWDAFKETLEAGGDCLEFYGFLITHGL